MDIIEKVVSCLCFVCQPQNEKSNLIYFKAAAREVKVNLSMEIHFLANVDFISFI